MSFLIQSLPLSLFMPLFGADEETLRAVGACLMIADAPNSAPCRVSLTDAEPGENLLLVSHHHLEDLFSPIAVKVRFRS